MSYPCNLCIDGYVLPDSFTNAVRSGATDDIEYIAGMVTGDGIAFKLTPFGVQIDEEKALTIINDFFGKYAEEVLALYPLNKEYPDFTFTQMGHDSLLLSICMFAQERNNHKSAYLCVRVFSCNARKGQCNVWCFHSSDMPYFWNIFSDERKDDWTDKGFCTWK